MYRFKSINTKILIIVIAIISLIIFISSSIIYFEFRNILFERIKADQKSIMLQNKMNIENLTNGINQATVYLYSDKALSGILTDKTKDAVQVFSNKLYLKKLFTYYATVPLTSNLNTYFEVLFINNGFPIARELESFSLGDEMLKLNDVFNTGKVENQDWYNNTIKLNGALYTFLIEKDKNKIYMARLVRNLNIRDIGFSDIVGVVAVGIDVKSLKTQIESSKLTKSTQVLLIDKDGRFIFSNNGDVSGKDLSSYPLAEFIRSSDNGEPFDITYNKEKYLATKYSLNWGWTLISMIPYNEITEGLNIIGNITFFTSIAALIIGIILSLILSNTISRPIRKLASVMQRIKDESNMDIHIESGYTDEVGMLYASFNSMMKRINKLVSEVFESSKKQRNAELKALQSQINPHFIYNTLDLINWLALCKNMDSVIDMVSSLAFVLRYSIKNPDEKVTLEEEVKHVEKYVSIQFLRNKNRFDIEYSIEPDILKCRMPKFLIQPLIENAINHGFKKNDKLGLIILSAKKHEDKIEIYVRDNGIGADTVELNDYLEGKVTRLMDSDGFGIKNVNERIKLNYGNEYGLYYESNEDMGIKAHIILPLEL